MPTSKTAKCKTCGTAIWTNNISGLCYKCLKDKQDAEKLAKWQATGDASKGVSTTLRGVIRAYIQEKQNNCCAICGQPTIWNGKPLILILDHIDGNAANDSESNLRLICSNCDSQLETYKSRNKNSARVHRK